MSLTTDQCPVAHTDIRSRNDAQDTALVSFRSEEAVRARAAIVRIDTRMRRNYADLKADLIGHLTPVIVVNNDPTGGEYTLLLDGERESLRPVAPAFELAKSVAHVPLGIYSILAPYLGGDTDEWRVEAEGFRETLAGALRAAPRAGMAEELVGSCSSILTAGIGFLDTCLRRGRFERAAFEEFAAEVYPKIRTNMEHASAAQIAGAREALGRWRARIGEERWPDVYVVVLSIWTTSELNQSSIIIRGLLDPSTVDSHLIDLPMAEVPADPVFTALDNLARIVQDNVAAEMIFPTDRRTADALKGKEDLLSSTILQQLQCPMAANR